MMDELIDLNNLDNSAVINLKQEPTCVSSIPVRQCQSSKGNTRDQRSSEIHRWKMHMREKGEKTTSLEAPSFWQRVKGKLPRYYFSLSWHEVEAGKGRGAVRCVRQQVRLGLPCQEVGRACGSYLIYGRAEAQRPILTFSEQRRGGIKSQQWRWKRSDSSPTATSFIHWAFVGKHVYACVRTQVSAHAYEPSSHSTAASKVKVTGATASLQAVGGKVSNEEDAASPWT